ncbi:MAG: helix-turn-helix transcriptional regulator, partial [Allorhizobium sp.]
MSIRSRHDRIVRLLRRNGSSKVMELAEEVGASRRTVLRDISALRDQGFVIHSECGPGGGVHLDPGSVQAASQLSVVETFALLISVATMRAARTFPFSDLADAGLAKIEKSMSADKVKDLRGLLDSLHVGELSPKQELTDVGAMDEALLPVF